jgi:peptidylprolyl isomerase
MNEILKKLRPIAILFAVSAVLIVGIAWMMNDVFTTDDIQITETSENLPGPLTPEEIQAYNASITNNMNPIAVLKTNYGEIEIELFQDYMPITAGNFAKLVKEGFYDTTKFHRVIDGFMIQGGDPNTKTDDALTYGKGGPGYSIPDEHIKGELLTNVRGTISMANSGPNTGGSQFFINLADNKALDFDVPDMNNSAHPVFGRVVNGMDVVDTIGRIETNLGDMPLEPVVIESATIKE